MSPTIREEELQRILKDCEKELLEMSLLEAKGGEVKDMKFKSPIFRFIWLKLTEPLRNKAQYHSKGLPY